MLICVCIHKPLLRIFSTVLISYITQNYTDAVLLSNLNPSLYYVAGSQGSNVSGHRRRNAVTVRHGGTVSTNVWRCDCRGCLETFLNIKKIRHGSHAADDILNRTKLDGMSVTKLDSTLQTVTKLG